MSMEQEGLAPFTASDGVTLFRRVYEPAGEPLGELLLGHGIGENSSRYIQAARAFAAAGWRTCVRCLVATCSMSCSSFTSLASLP